MCAEKFDEAFEIVFDNSDDFFDELKERCTNTKIFRVKPENISFYAGKVSNDTVHLSRLENNAVNTFDLAIDTNKQDVWQGNEAKDVGIFMRFTDENGANVTAPISPLCKLSLGNRSKLSFVGDLSIPVNKLALACLYEEFLKRETKKNELQVVCVYGKVQAVMTNVYSPIAHDKFFEMVKEKLCKRFDEKRVSLRRGYVSQKWSRATWYIGEYSVSVGGINQNVQLGLSAIDSQNGHSGAILQPCLFSGRKNRGMLFDDAWYAKHMALTEEGISEALETVYMTLQDNAQKLIDSTGICLNYPSSYAQKMCNELNKLARQTSTQILSAKTINSFLSAVSGLEAIRSSVTVWDIIDILWDIPENEGVSESHKDSLMKTVSRVLCLNHSAFDVN